MTESTIGSLRGKDPRRTSTVTMHLPGPVDAAGRMHGVKSHHMGPGMKVIGGQLQSAFEERPKVTVQVDDMNTLSRTYQTLPDTLRAPNLYSTGTLSQLQTREGQSTVAGSTGSSGSSGTRKMVYWDGRGIIVADRTGGKDAMETPHMTAKDVEPGTFFGVRETPGSDPTKIVGSNHRRMPDEEGQPLRTGETAGRPTGRPYTPTHKFRSSGTIMSGTFNRSTPLNKSWVGPNTGKLGLAPYAPTHLLRSFGPGEDVDEEALRSYASTKRMGHREYEAHCKSYDFLNCWETTDSHLNTSMLLGRPSRLLTPYEHSTTRLSLRRPATSQF